VPICGLEPSWNSSGRRPALRRRGLEAASVAGEPREDLAARIVADRPQADVVERVVGEQRCRVAGRTPGGALEQLQPELLIRGQRTHVPGDERVIWRLIRNQRPLVARERERGAPSGDRRVTERGLEQRRVRRIGRQRGLHVGRQVRGQAQWRHLLQLLPHVLPHRHRGQ
jgi:hypothetical protein